MAAPVLFNVCSSVFQRIFPISFSSSCYQQLTFSIHPVETPQHNALTADGSCRKKTRYICSLVFIVALHFLVIGKIQNFVNKAAYLLHGNGPLIH